MLSWIVLCHGASLEVGWQIRDFPEPKATYQQNWPYCAYENDVLIGAQRPAAMASHRNTFCGVRSSRLFWLKKSCNPQTFCKKNLLLQWLSNSFWPKKVRHKFCFVTVEGLYYFGFAREAFFWLIVWTTIESWRWEGFSRYFYLQDRLHAGIVDAWRLFKITCFYEEKHSWGLALWSR